MPRWLSFIDTLPLIWMPLSGFVLGEQLFVRATEDVVAGGEVTLNWVGQLLTAPLQQRRAELSDKYGFVCECKRWAHLGEEGGEG